MIKITNSPEETKHLAEDLAKEIKNSGGIVALKGDLGAGKTTFAQGFAKGLGVEEKIISPTFIVIRQYEVPDTKMMFHHIDLYRFEDNFDLKQSGIQEILENKKSITLIEWAEKLNDKLPKGSIVVKLKRLSEDKREIIIN
ncbi:MAG: ATP-binding protein [Candidatus Daviesbacteria bacterium GW2011_GWA2_38_24]|uniref:tRNA threonylcarbamoyladenosine biosynthesis protein TsaE n=1 Tax=Candidatus Daviesbacteria bacterium GW2011_GWA2_38_24 TaxID=1618422 RepID=A0A0G0M0W7_9BACT|nr:MAG: ATP-binding protein [Candidatus Daviesbacteria bacterium GW2011_GWA2_38_24]KKQ79650.1 MAG: ATP-binding protein [Candidatus Daviesbacteria bacterium GW2011_GWA1_38_7]OGE23549.1 MAG: tRNA (adenosine(37)-N6)-threonylcarbamoyltransferase complex ATPase subunit type 1 TsaE [Candidatus Daviesbacteria bacterium RIFCSPHIGHO2_01_FULL_38_8]